MSRLKVWNGCFRPLSGSYISQWRANVHTDRTGPVSVPYRGATFLNTKKCTFHVMPIPVSVPYRGATFLNEVFKYYKKKNKPVSVPYRGATFLNTLPDLTIHLVSFPSPIGELHFSMVQSVLLLIVLQKNSFRPLSGSYISQ